MHQTGDSRQQCPECPSPTRQASPTEHRRPFPKVPRPLDTSPSEYVLRFVSCRSSTRVSHASRSAAKGLRRRSAHILIRWMALVMLVVPLKSASGLGSDSKQSMLSGRSVSMSWRAICGGVLVATQACRSRTKTDHRTRRRICLKKSTRQICLD